MMHKTIKEFSSPPANKLMVNSRYEAAGVIPFGVTYPVVNDRRRSTAEALVGKRIASFDCDKVQAIMSQKIGAQPAAVDVTNLAGKFNNGSVDFISAQAMVYSPLDMHRGIYSKGASDLIQALVLAYKLIINKAKLPEGFCLKSRQYWLSDFNRAMSLMNKSEKDISAETLGDLAPESMAR